METGEALQTFYTMGANLKKIHVCAEFTTFVTVDSIGILYILKKVEGEFCSNPDQTRLPVVL